MSTLQTSAKHFPNPTNVFWTPFAHFADSTRWQRLNLEGWHNMPAIDLLGANRPALWGLTYRMVAQMAGFAGVDLPERP